MSVEHRPEQPKLSPDAQRLLQLKEQLTTSWQELPAEHKASMALVLVEDLMESEYRLWFREALDTRWPVTSGTIHNGFALIQVSTDDLQEIGLDEAEIALCAHGFAERLYAFIFGNDFYASPRQQRREQACNGQVKTYRGMDHRPLPFGYTIVLRGPVQIIRQTAMRYHHAFWLSCRP